jgi:hypothetical protein
MSTRQGHSPSRQPFAPGKFKQKTESHFGLFTDVSQLAKSEQRRCSGAKYLKSPLPGLPEEASILIHRAAEHHAW